MIELNESKNSSAFAEHLETLEFLSVVTRRVASQLPQVSAAEKTLTQIWDILSKAMPTPGTATVEDLGAISSIIQRVASATKSIQSLESEVLDFARKAVNFEAAKQALLNPADETNGSPKKEISAETIALIEERLKLL